MFVCIAAFYIMLWPGHVFVCYAGALKSRCCDPALLLSQSVGWLAVSLMTSALRLLTPPQERTPHNDNDFVFATEACDLKVCRLSACEAWRWREHDGAGVV